MTERRADAEALLALLAADDTMHAKTNAEIGTLLLDQVWAHEVLGSPRELLLSEAIARLRGEAEDPGAARAARASATTGDPTRDRERFEVVCEALTAAGSITRDRRRDPARALDAVGEPCACPEGVAEAQRRASPPANPGPSLAEIAEKADGYATHMETVDGLKSVLRIIAQNVRDAVTRAPANPGDDAGALRAEYERGYRDGWETRRPGATDCPAANRETGTPLVEDCACSLLPPQEDPKAYWSVPCGCCGANVGENCRHPASAPPSPPGTWVDDGQGFGVRAPSPGETRDPEAKT